MRKPFIFHASSTFSISIVQQFVGLFRHILIAAYFGVSRGFDSYLVVYAFATLLVFNLAIVFDSVAVPRLVQTKSEKGHDQFWQMSNNLLAQSIVGGAIVVVAFSLLLRLMIPVIGAGFSPSEKLYVVELSIYFLPWVFVIVPYYAVVSHLKALWDFQWVFGAEIVTMLVSIAVLLVWHSDIRSLPIAYFAGYLATALLLLGRRGLKRVAIDASVPSLLTDMAHQHLANQGAAAGGFVDRYFQSYLTAGGISALGYAGQIVNNLSSLLTFREIYVVPLAEKDGRSEKLERVLKAVLLISIPAGLFVVAFAEPIVRLLFQRGQFTEEAVLATANVLQILAVSLVVSSILGPMARLFQIVNRVIFTYALYATSFVGTAVLQYVFVFVLHWDVRGFAFASVLNSALITAVVAYLVKYCGVTIAWHRVLGYAGYAVIFAALAAYLGSMASATLPVFLRLLVGGVIYTSIVAGGYLLIHRRIRLIAGIG
jgi:putative peptidoglycan lipid II flippase